MPPFKPTKKLVLIATAVTAVTGGGVAYAATSTDNPRQQFLDDVAKRLDVTPDKLNDALKGAFEAQLDREVAAGRLTQTQADAIKQRVEKSGAVPLGGGFGHKRVFKLGFGAPLEAAAKYLGLTEAQLRDKLEDGKSLADVAKDEDKSVDGLEDAIVAAHKAELEKAVSSGKLTDAQRDEIVKRFEDHVDELVAREGFGPRLQGRFRHRGPDGAGFAGPAISEAHDEDEVIALPAPDSETTSQ